MSGIFRGPSYFCISSGVIKFICSQSPNSMKGLLICMFCSPLCCYFFVSHCGELAPWLWSVALLVCVNIIVIWCVKKVVQDEKER